MSSDYRPSVHKPGPAHSDKYVYDIYFYLEVYFYSYSYSPFPKFEGVYRSIVYLCIFLPFIVCIFLSSSEFPRIFYSEREFISLPYTSSLFYCLYWRMHVRNYREKVWKFAEREMFVPRQCTINSSFWATV